MHPPEQAPQRDNHGRSGRLARGFLGQGRNGGNLPVRRTGYAPPASVGHRREPELLRLGTPHCREDGRSGSTVEANVGKPQVAYKETIRKKIRAEGKFIRQSGGRGQYGHAIIEVEPVERGKGYEFVNKIVGGAIPKEFIGPVDAGIQEAMNTGLLAGFPVVDLKVTLVDGSYHDVDSSEMAFKIAGSMAIKDAQKNGDSALLEPVMKVDVTVPEDYMGDVIGDVNSRRGRLEGMEDRSGMKVIHAYVPLSEMFGYATDLRSKTQGRGNFSMQFDHYEELPKNVQEQVIGQRAALKKD